MGTEYDVVIAGAGLAGSSLACVLAGLGWKVALLDPGSGPKHKVCGEFLSPEAGATLRRLGLSRLVGGLAPVPVHSARLILPTGTAMDLPFPQPGTGISRFKLDRALLEQAVERGADFFARTPVTGIRETDSGWEVQGGRNGEASVRIQSRCVFGAWGRSGEASVRPEPERAAPGQAPWMGVKTHLEAVSALSKVELYFFPGGYIGLSDVEDGRVNASALLTRAFFRESDGTVLGALELIQSRNTHLARRLSGSRPVPGTSAAVSPVPLNRRVVPWGIVPHIGDAAAVIPPLCGDGMSMALRSVEHAAGLAHRYLTGTISRTEWRQRYTEAVRKEFARPVRWGRLLQGALTDPLWSRVLLQAGRRWPGLARHVFEATRLR